MADLITLGALAGYALSGWVGNRADNLVCRQTRAVLKSIQAGNQHPRNGDLTRAIRQSQLLALRLGIKAYKDLPEKHERGGTVYKPERIATRLQMWIDAAMASETLSVNPVEMEAVEAQIERAFLHPEPHEGSAAARLAAFRDIAVNWTLAEARAEVVGAPDWQRFATLLSTGAQTKHGHYPGWWPVFRAFLAEEIKHDEVVQRILVEQGIAKLIDQQEGLKATLDEMQVGLENVVAALRESLNELREASREVTNAASRIEAALKQIDDDFERIIPTLARIEAGMQQLPEQLRQIIESSNRSWHGILQDLGQAELDAERLKDRPTELLIARYRVVPFYDRGGVLASVRDWVTEGSGPRAKGRLYVAPGGYGKTRLGIELLAELTKISWRVTFLSQRNAANIAPGAIQDLLRTEGGAGVCIVVDYADGQLELLRALVNGTSLAPRGLPIRVLAFARSAEGWWSGFSGETTVFDPKPFEALEDPPSSLDCGTLYELARKAFAEQFRKLGLPYREPKGTTSAIQADRPLLIAAAAFLDTIGVERASLSIFKMLYQVERNHWRRALGAKADDEIDDLARAAAQVTLVQGATEEGALALMKADTSERIFSPKAVLIMLRRLYGHRVIMGVQAAEDEREAVFIGPIEPDLLGEHVTMEVLHRNPVSLLDATLRTALTGQPLFRDDTGLILAVLTRATHPQHDPGIRRSAERAIASIEILVPKLTAFQVRHFANSLPSKSISLSELAVTVVRRLVEVAPQGSSPAEIEHRAYAQSELSARLSSRGYNEEALAASEEAVRLHRQLVGIFGNEFLLGLSSALLLHSHNLIALGRRRAAVAPAEEAVELNRELDEQSSEKLGVGLAESLQNLSEIYASIGRNDKALELSKDACGRFEALAIKDPVSFLPGFSSALNSLRNRLYTMDQAKEALEATSRAVEIQRQLVAKNRDAYLAGLAAILNNVSNDLSISGKKDEALAAIAEAIKYHRELVEKNRGAYLPNLAHALQVSGVVHFDSGQKEQGLTLIMEAISLLQEIAGKNGDVVIPALAGTLGNAAKMLSELGRPDEACKILYDASKLIRPLAIKFPKAFKSQFLHLRDRYLRLARGCVSRESGAEAAWSRVKVKRIIPEGSTAFDEADRLLQIVMRGRATGMGKSADDEPLDEQAAVRIEHVLAAEEAELALFDFLADNETDETLAPIADLAGFFLDLSTLEGPIGGPECIKLFDGLLLALKRARAKAHPEDADVRGDLAQTLLSNGDDPEHGAELIQELHDLREANPQDSAVREMDAWALHVEINRAAEQGDKGHHNLKLEQLRVLSAQYPDDESVRAPLARSLENYGEWAIHESDARRRDTVLNELRALANAFPEDGSVRLALTKVLFAAGAMGRLNGSPEDEFWREIFRIVEGHPGDAALKEFFHSRFKKE